MFYCSSYGPGGSMRACHAAGPGSILGRDKFSGWGFWGFSSPVRQMSGSFRPPRSPNNIWPSLSSILIHYGGQWPEMWTRPKTSNIHTYILFWSHKDIDGHPRWVISSDTTRTLKTIHIIHSHIHSNVEDMRMMIRWPNDIRRSGGPKASWHLSNGRGQIPKKKFTQENFLDRESNPGPLRDRHAFYRLLHRDWL